MLTSAFGEARAEPPSSDSCAGRNERWAWAQILKQGEANFEIKCGAAHGGAQQSDNCRRLSGKCVAQRLTRDPQLDQEKIVHIRLVGAMIDGDVDLTDADLSRREISIENSVFGRLALDNAKADQLNLKDSKISGDASAGRLTAERNLDLSGATFEQSVTLDGAQIGGALDMSGAHFEKGLSAERIKVDRRLQMQGAKFDEDVNLSDAKLGELDMSRTRFNGTMILSRLQTTGDVSLECGVYSQEIDVMYAHVGGNLSLNGADYRTFSLNGANVEKDMTIKFMDCGQRQTERPKKLDLRNMQLGRLLILGKLSEGVLPEHLELEGFSVSHVGRDDERGAEWWEELIKRDQRHSSQPYRRIAAAFAAAGDRDLADQLLYDGRRQDICEKGSGGDGRCPWRCGFLQALASEYTARCMWSFG
jgi:uncharacterized protein YjbI with pentapeptide repeats